MTKPQPEQLNEKLKLLIIVVAILNVLFFGIYFLVFTGGSSQPEKEVIAQTKVVDTKECFETVEIGKTRGTKALVECYEGPYDIQRALKESEAVSKSKSSVHDEEFNELMEGRQ